MSLTPPTLLETRFIVFQSGAGAGQPTMRLHSCGSSKLRQISFAEVMTRHLHTRFVAVRVMFHLEQGNSLGEGSALEAVIRGERLVGRTVH